MSVGALQNEDKKIRNTNHPPPFMPQFLDQDHLVMTNQFSCRHFGQMLKTDHFKEAKEK